MRRRITNGTLLVVAVWLAGFVAVSAATRPVTFDDIMSMKAVQSPVISPDGRAVLFTVREWVTPGQDGGGEGPGQANKGLPKKEMRSHVWLVPADTAVAGAAGQTGGARQITFSDRDETSPDWSPDGRFMSFLSTRGSAAGQGAAQIYLMRTDGGEAWKLTDAKEAVGGYVWSPDGKQIAFTTRDPLPKDLEQRRKAGDDPRVFEGDFRYVHIWVIDVESKKAMQVTSGNRFTVNGLPSWAPDGRRLAFAAGSTPMNRDTRSDIYIVGLDSKAIERITTNPGPDSSPAWSPDGSTIAYLSQPEEGKPYADGIAPAPVTDAHLVLFDVASQQVKDAATSQFPRAADRPIWTPDSKRIVFGTADRVYETMFAYDIAARRYLQLTNGKLITQASFSRDGSRVAFQMESPAAPTDVYVADAAFASPVKLTAINPQAADFSLGEQEVVTWKSADGLEIEGVLLKPVGYQPGRKYPLLVVIHGGPAGVHRNNYRVKAGDAGQHWAGRGWAVLFPNPRGSAAYGEKFLRANIRDWGGGDYRDIMAGVDAMIQRGIADPNRLAELGWSYGGYMTCRIVSQTGRFKAAMMGAGLADLTSMYGTTDIPNLLGAHFGGMPSAEALSLYADRSGLTNADKVTTPLLILHGANDDRVPTGQSMEFFRALKDRGKTVELVLYPRAGHGLTEYYHQLDRLRRQYEWITRFTLGEDVKKTTSHEPALR